MTHHGASNSFSALQAKVARVKLRYQELSKPLWVFILCRKQEIILTALTGAAADKLGGNTYHTSLGINLSYKAAVSTRVRRLWAQKTILVIDEMSIVDLKMLSVINNQCKVARSLPRSSPELFGGLPIVSAQIPFPGLLTYTRDMPTVMLTNACTPLGQVNGSKGTAVGVALDSAGKSPVGIQKLN